jgi:hypothetical protein
MISSFFRGKGQFITSTILLSSAICPILSSCGGGGGGGGDFVGAAQVQLQASPTIIDTGDRMLVKARISDVNDNGIALKFRYPTGLSYVPSSSSLLAGNHSLDISPAVNVIEGNYKFLVYYIPQSDFGENARGTVELLLEGSSRVLEGALEVDADVDNPLIGNDKEFDPKTPEFAAEDSIAVEVEG